MHHLIVFFDNPGHGHIHAIYGPIHLFRNTIRQIRIFFVDWRAVFDHIGKSIPDYYYGRFDLKVPSLDDLYQGKNIRIMELNGVNSEPAHIYDPDMRIGPAYRALFRQARIIQQIAVYNHRQRGVAYAPFWQMFRDLRAHLFSS